MLRGGRQVGVIAKDVEKFYPELVKTNNLGYKMVDYSKLSAVFLEGIKEQQIRIDTQQKEIDDLKAMVNSLLINQTAVIRAE